MPNFIILNISVHSGAIIKNKPSEKFITFYEEVIKLLSEIFLWSWGQADPGKELWTLRHKSPLADSPAKLTDKGKWRETAL